MDVMTEKRYTQIERNGGDLTHDEQAAGWHFCYGVNAGKLLNESDPRCACSTAINRQTENNDG